MKRIGRRLISLVLVAAMVLTLLPATAMAAGLEELRAAAEQEAGGQPPASAAEAEDPSPSAGFADVPEGMWAYDAVAYVSDHGIFNGTSATEFAPGGAMTRAMMVTVLGRMAQVDPADYAGTPQFTDVAAGSWYAPYVLWAAQAGITDGVGGGRFAPDEAVTRAQMAVFLWRFFRYMGAALPEAVREDLPGDYGAIPSYAQEAAAALWRCGIFQGGGDGGFDPHRAVTRAEVATLCMRVDGYLVETGVKEYPEEGDSQPEEPQEPEDEKPGGSGSGGGRPGDDDDDRPGGTNDPYYEPDAENTPVTAVSTDVDPGFSIPVYSSDPSMTADAVLGAITATDTSSLEDGTCIDVSGSGGAYTITGVQYVYNEAGEQVREDGFAPGHTYKIVLDDDRLTFAGEEPSVREYDLTVARAEEMNLKLNEGLVYIPAGQIGGIIENGRSVDSMDAALFYVDEDGVRESDGALTGSFEYTGDGLEEGDVVAVYEGQDPRERDSVNDTDAGAISYVKITDVEDTTYTYRGATMEEVLFIPTVFPVASSYQAESGETTMQATMQTTVPVSAFSDEAYRAMGLTEEEDYENMGLGNGAQPEAGDFLAFYSGSLTEESAEAIQPQYAEIQDVKLDDRGTTDVNDDAYVITYEAAELTDVLGSMDTFLESNVNLGLTEEDIDQLERSIETKAMKSGFAEEAANQLAAMALQTDSIEELRGVTVSPTGEVGAKLPSLPSYGGGSGQVEVELGTPDVQITETLEHFAGKEGLRVALTLPFTVTFNSSSGNAVVLDFEPTFIQELKVDLNASVRTIWDNFIYIIWWIDEFEVNASIDLYTFTDIMIDMNLTVDDGQGDIVDSIEAVKETLSDLEALLDGEADAETGRSLSERYVEMLENDTDWVDLFEQQIFRVKKNLALVVRFSFQIDFVISTNVNVYVGVEFMYEMGRRYNFTIRVFDGKATSNTTSLLPEKYSLDVYVMGVLGLRAGLRLSISVALIDKAVAGAGLSAEVGPYLQLSGFFAYNLSYEENQPQTSQASGAMYIEVGIYVDINADVSAIGGLLSWTPSIYSGQFPLWSAGNRYPIVGFVESEVAEKEIWFDFGNPAGFAPEVFQLVALDLLTGDEIVKAYPVSDFTITTTNDAVEFDPQYTVLWGPWGDRGSSQNTEETGQVIITWNGDNGELSFSTGPIQRVIDFTWSQLNQGGYSVFLITGTTPSWIEIHGEYGAEMEYPWDTIESATADRPGYVFSHWEDAKGQKADLPDAIPYGNTDYYAVWDKVPVEYTIRHYYENPDGTYTDHYDDEIKSGLMDDYVTGEGDYKGTPDGFASTPWTCSTAWIGREGIVLAAYHERDSYTLTFAFESPVGGQPRTISQEVKWGTSTYDVGLPTMLGYDVVTPWNAFAAEYDYAMPMKDVTIEVSMSSDVSYEVRHVVQQENGAYVEAETEAAMSTPGTKVSDTIEDVIDGFLEREGMTKEDYTPSYSDATVAFNGSTVVEVRYTLADLHSASFYEQETNTFLGMAYYREGDTITIPTSIQREGYAPVFADEDETPTMGNTNVDLNITWVLADNGYTVEHYLQGEDGEYVLDRRTSVPGEAGDPVSDTIQSQLLKLEGYREIRYDEDAVISEDGTIVVEVYYDRYVATFVNDSAEYGTPGTVKTVYFLSGSPAVEAPELTGVDSDGKEVTVTGWTYTLEDGATVSGIPETMPAQDITFTALWSADWAPYTVQYHVQDTTGDGYTAAGTETQMGTVGQTAAEYDGLTGEYLDEKKFTVRTESAAITADGSTVLHVYYDRVPYTITYYLNDNNASFATGVSNTATYRYGAALSLLTNRDVSCPNMVFGGWYTDAGCADETRFTDITMPVGNVDLYAKWTKGYTVTVNHYKQIADSGEYGTPATEAIAVPTGTTSISSQAKDYTADHYQLAECKVVIGSNTTTLTGDEASGPIDLTGVTDTSQITVNYYYDLETYTLTVTYLSSTYSDQYAYESELQETEKTEPFQARYGQTLNSAFTGSTARFGYDLAGFEAKDGAKYDLEATMPADDMEVTATWTAWTVTLTFDYDGRMDLFTKLQEIDEDAVSWSKTWNSYQFDITLTYGEPFMLPTADEIPGLESMAGGVEAGKNLCANCVFLYPGSSDIIWEQKGNGTEDDPIMIYSASGLKAYHDYTNPNGLTGDGKYYQLGANLDLSRVSASEGDFEGILHLDGAGHTISNYTGSRGLFSALHDGSTVENLTIENASVSGGDIAGILADQVLGITPANYDDEQTINFGNVTLTDIIVTNSSVSGTNAGGLVGRVGPKDADWFASGWLKANGPYLYLTGCSVDESVSVTGTNAGRFVGLLEKGAVLSVDGSESYDESYVGLD